MSHVGSHGHWRLQFQATVTSHGASRDALKIAKGLWKWSRSPNDHSTPMDSRKQKPKQKAVRAQITHARTHACIISWIRSAEKPNWFCADSTRGTPHFFFVRVTQQGHLSGSPRGGSSLRWPCRATHPTPSIVIAVKVFAEGSAFIVKKRPFGEFFAFEGHHKPDPGA